MGSISNCFIPDDLVVEILSRLPVKSLLQYKTVCKLWYILINSPNFVANHHKNQTHQLFIHHYNYHTDRCCFTIFPDDSLLTRQDLDYIQFPPSFDPHLIGPVNGLFAFYYGCHHRNECIALWNPATREFRSLPIPVANHTPHLRHQFGFGFDPLTNDYKLVWIVYNYIVMDPVITLYSLANDSWRYLDSGIDASLVNLICRIMYHQSSSGIYLNGAYYWTSRPDHLYCKLVLFDMSTHLFREIQGPEPCPYYCELVLHNDSITLLGLKEESPKFLDMWVMKSEGCWTKVFTVFVGPHVNGWPLGIWKTGEIFMHQTDDFILEIAPSSELVLYNTNTRDCRNVGVQGTDSLIWVLSYKESLVSVKGGSSNWYPLTNLSDTLQHFFTRCCVCFEERAGRPGW